MKPHNSLLFDKCFVKLTLLAGPLSHWYACGRYKVQFVGIRYAVVSID